MMNPILSNPDLARGWLAGLIDGEGCVYYRIGSNSRRVITISMTDKDCIDSAAQCFDLLGIEYSRFERKGATANRKYVYGIEVRKSAAMQRVFELIPIQHPEKRQKLIEALSFVRGLHCKECGCLHDEQTPGCYDCRKRHQWRAAYQRVKNRKVMQRENGNAENDDTLL